MGVPPAPDTSPANRAGAGISGGETARPFTGYAGKYGLLKTNIVTSYAGIGMMLGGPFSADGTLFLQSAESIADAWIAWGRADPKYMRIVTLMWGSPFMTLFVAHAPLVGGVMANHGVSVGKLLMPMNMRRMGEIAQLRQSLTNRRAGGQGASPSDASAQSQAPAAPLAYQPSGPFAPTEAAPPPPPADDSLRMLPDEGLPAEIDVHLRELARTQHVPYAELRDQALLQIAQLRMAQNGHVAGQASGLGVPVAKPE